MTQARARWPDLLLAVALGLLVLAPVLLRGGFVLVGDMVFVPDQPWKDAWTGGDGRVPRAVPGDAWVAVLDDLVGGELLQKGVLLLILVGAGTGMASLLAALPGPARAAGSVLYVWNPYVYERLAIGHWALLCGYAALPWAVRAVLSLRGTDTGEDAEADTGADAGSDTGADAGGARRGWALLVVALTVAAWTSPTGGLLVLVVALLCAGSRRGLALRVLGVGAWVNLPWIVPALLNQADQLAPDPLGVTAFASRADTPFGVLGSLVTMGGIWKESILPDDRAEPWSAGVGLGIVVLALAGLVLARRSPVLRPWVALAISAGALLVASLSAFDLTRPLVEWVVVHVPGGGLVRDSQKWLAPWVLVVCTGFASFVAWLHARVARFGGHGLLWLGTLAATPLLALPSMAMGLGGFLQPAEYPQEWFEVRDLLEEQADPDDRVVVLPFSTYRRFDWNVRTVLDPAPRFFPGDVTIDDSLVVPEGAVGGESAFASRVRETTDGDVLAALLAEEGVEWVLVHAGAETPLLPTGAEAVRQGDQLSLYGLSGADDGAGQDTGPRPLLLASLDAAVLVGAGALALVSTKRSRRSAQKATDAYSA